RPPRLVLLCLPTRRSSDLVAAYTVAGTFDLGAAAANDRLAFLDPNAVAEALGLSDDEYSAIEIQVADVFTSTEVGERLRSPGVEDRKSTRLDSSHVKISYA